MRYMIGSGGSGDFIAPIQRKIPDVGRLMIPSDWREPILPYACDNGVYTAHVKGKVWNQDMHEAYLRMLAKMPADNPPLWVLLPDAVADWKRTVELASLYIPLLRQYGYCIALALQDGCDFEEALALEPDWVFVGGSTEWKEANIHAVCEFFQPKGIKVHVGRVNTARRLRICQSAGADSCDGTILNKFRDKKIHIIKNALDQGCLTI